MKEKSSNYWPHFIIALVIFAIILGIWTVKTAIDNPVELDNSYMMSYQKVNKDIYKIAQDKKKFEKSYEVFIAPEKLQKGSNIIEIKILDKETKKPIKGAKVTVLATRPDTTKHDIKKEAHFENGVYKVVMDLPLEGRWNIMVRIELNGLTYYKTVKLSTRGIIKQNLKNS